MLVSAAFARLLLAAVFGLAGITKLADPAGSRKALLDFGLGDWLSRPLAILLPAAEIAIAGALISKRFAFYGGFAALALLALFVLVISSALVRGRKPNCHCFGQLYSKPIGWDLVARNCGLCVISAVVLYAGPRQAGIWGYVWAGISGHELLLAFGVALLAITAGHCWLTFQLVQQSGRVLLRLDALERQFAGTRNAAAQVAPAAPAGLPVGEKAPSFSLPDLSERAVEFEELLAASRPLLLLFVHPDCGPCKSLLPIASAWLDEAAACCELVVISQGSRKENVANIKGLSFPHFLLQDAHEVSDAYLCAVTPSAVVVRPDHTIGSPVASGVEQIQTLLANVINESVAPLGQTSLRKGELLPRLLFPDLDGSLTPITGVEGQTHLLLFWNPSCGFCRQMVPDVNRWHEERQPLRPSLAIISSGSAGENRELGLKGRVLLDPSFSTGELFSAHSTPSAVLLDEHGRVSSKLAIGREEILMLVSQSLIAV